MMVRVFDTTDFPCFANYALKPDRGSKHKFNPTTILRVLKSFYFDDFPKSFKGTKQP